MQTALGDVEFIGGDLIPNRADAASELLPKIADSNADAILVIHLSFDDSRPFKTFADSGRPVAIYSLPFSGHDWMYVPRLQKTGVRVIMAPSRDLAEIDRLAALLRVPPRMKQSRIVLMGEPGCAAGTAAARSEDTGIACSEVPIGGGVNAGNLKNCRAFLIETNWDGVVSLECYGSDENIRKSVEFLRALV